MIDSDGVVTIRGGTKLQSRWADTSRDSKPRTTPQNPSSVAPKASRGPSAPSPQRAPRGPNGNHVPSSTPDNQSSTSQSPQKRKKRGGKRGRRPGPPVTAPATTNSLDSRIGPQNDGIGNESNTSVPLFSLEYNENDDFDWADDDDYDLPRSMAQQGQ